MKTKLCVFAVAILLAGPAFAQEPLEKAGTTPSTAQTAPSPKQGASEPLDKAGTESSTTMPAPHASTSNEPLDVGTLRKTEDDNKMVGALGATVDRVEEMDIYDANGNKIAEVDSILEDKNGVIKGIAIEYGGFLGIGEKGAIMTLDQVKEKNGSLVTEMSEEQLPTLPSWAD